MTSAQRDTGNKTLYMMLLGIQYHYVHCIYGDRVTLLMTYYAVDRSFTSFLSLTPTETRPE